MKFRIYKTIKDNEVIYIPKYKKGFWWSYITCSNGCVDKKGLYNKLHDYVCETAITITDAYWPKNKLGIYTTYDFVHWSPAAYATTYEGAVKIINMYTNNYKNDIEFIDETINDPINITFESV